MLSSFTRWIRIGFVRCYLEVYSRVEVIEASSLLSKLAGIEVRE